MSCNSQPNDYRLPESIVARSVADNWQAAKLEWTLDRIYKSDSTDRCLCGHVIRECCLIKNHHTGKDAVVGTCCVKKFLELDTQGLFNALQRIADNLGRSPSVALIDFAFQRRWIDGWQQQFSIDTHRKRKLSPRQKAKRVEINQAILEQSGWNPIN